MAKEMPLISLRREIKSCKSGINFACYPERDCIFGQRILSCGTFTLGVNLKGNAGGNEK